MNTVFFDLETQRTLDEVGGRQNIRKLGLAVAVTYSTVDGAFHHYTEETVAELIAALRAADRVVGFNLISFDYEVLRAYSGEPLGSIHTVDMLDHIYRRLRFRVSLDNLAGTTLDAHKSADGLQAVRWYKQGRTLTSWSTANRTWRSPDNSTNSARSTSTSNTGTEITAPRWCRSIGRWG